MSWLGAATGARCPDCGAGLPYVRSSWTAKTIVGAAILPFVTCAHCGAECRLAGSLGRQTVGFLGLFCLAVLLPGGLFGPPGVVPGLVATLSLIYRVNPVELVE